MFVPTWIVEYKSRRPTLRAPLNSSDYARVEVAGMNRDQAAAAFLQRFPPQCRIVAISMGSATGFA